MKKGIKKHIHVQITLHNIPPYSFIYDLFFVYSSGTFVHKPWWLGPVSDNTGPVPLLNLHFLWELWSQLRKVARINATQRNISCLINRLATSSFSCHKRVNFLQFHFVRVTNDWRIKGGKECPQWSIFLKDFHAVFWTQRASNKLTPTFWSCCSPTSSGHFCQDSALSVK